MERIERFETDPYLQSLTTNITGSGRDKLGFWVLLEESIFYPEGGGQPPDRGSINGVAVKDVQKSPEGIQHYLSHPLGVCPASLQLDWVRRFDHMQQHTAQHLITALAADHFGWQTTSFHLGPEQSDIELEVHGIGTTQLTELEELVASAVRSSLPVIGRRVSSEEFTRLKVRTRGLPKDHEGSIRLVDIQGVDLNTCGGTHVGSTGELESVHLIGTEGVRGQTRIYYVAGGRARRRLAGQEFLLAELRSRLDSGNADLGTAVQRSLDQNRVLSRQVRALEEELAGTQIDSFLNRSDKVMAGHYEGRPLPFLQRIARQVVSRDPSRVLFLTSSVAGPREGMFLVAAGSDSGVSLQKVGQKVAAVLAGRGGGQPPVFQGKATRLDRREEALAEIRGER